MSETYPLPGFAAALMLALIALAPAGVADTTSFLASCGETFPTSCDPSELDGSELDGLCDIPTDTDATFPECLGGLPEQPDLDDLCDLDAETDATFPECLAGAPDEAAICVAIAPESTQSTIPECLQDAAVPSVDDLCAVSDDTAGTFPECITNMVTAAAQPVVDQATQEVAGALETADGLLATLTVNNALIGPIVSADTAPTAFADLEATFTGTFSRGTLGDELRAADEVGLLDLTFSVDVDGTSSAIVVAVDETASTFSFVYTSSEPGEHDFEINAVYDAPLNLFVGQDTLEDVVFNDAATDTVELFITVSSVPTTLNSVAFSPAYTVHAVGAAASKTLGVVLQDNNGVDDITTASLSTSLEVPGGEDVALASSGQTEATQGANDPFPSIRTYNYGVAFPARLKDGTYTFSATYEGTQETSTSVSVANVDPTIGTTSTVLNLATGKATPVAGTVGVTLDDLNFGKFGAATTSVAELKTLRLAVTAVGTTTAVGDIQLKVDGVDVLLTAGVGEVDLQAVTSMAAITRSVQVSYAQANDAGESDDGVFTVTAQAIDDNDAVSGLLTIATITVQPLEAGFGLLVDDGGDGIQLAAVEPGASTDNSADPLLVTVTKQDALGLLRFAVPAFSSGGNAIDSEGVTVKLCVSGTAAATCLTTPGATGTVADGVATFASVPLSLGEGGTSVDVYFTVDVPTGTPSGAYSTTVDVLGAPAA